MLLEVYLSDYNGLNLWWGMWESNPHAFRHMILSHARLPIPTIPRCVEIIAGLAGLHNPFNPLYIYILTDKTGLEPGVNLLLDGGRWKYGSRCG